MNMVSVIALEVGWYLALIKTYPDPTDLLLYELTAGLLARQPNEQTPPLLLPGLPRSLLILLCRRFRFR